MVPGAKGTGGPNTTSLKPHKIEGRGNRWGKIARFDVKSGNGTGSAKTLITRKESKEKTKAKRIHPYSGLKKSTTPKQ